MRMLDIGFGNFVNEDRIVVMLRPESAPVKRIIRGAGERGSLIDASFGRRTMTVIVTDSGHTVLSSISPEDIDKQRDKKDRTERITDE